MEQLPLIVCFVLFIGSLSSFLILNSFYFSSGCLWCYCYRWSIHCQVRGYYGSTGECKMFFAWYTQFILTWGNGGRIVNQRSGKGVAGGVLGSCDLRSVSGFSFKDNRITGSTVLMFATTHEFEGST